MMKCLKKELIIMYLSVLLEVVVEVLFTVFSFELYKLTQTIDNRYIIIKFTDSKTID